MITDLPLLRKITWNFVRAHPDLEFDDLFSEACCAYIDAMPFYDPERGQKSTFLWTVVTRHLQQIATSQGCRPEAVVDPDDQCFLNTPGAEPSPEQAYLAAERWGDFLSALSPLAQGVVAATLTPGESPLPVDKPKACRGVIVDRLREEGWGWHSIWRGLREVKTAVAALG